jgi:hypothetical protein
LKKKYDAQAIESSQSNYKMASFEENLINKTRQCEVMQSQIERNKTELEEFALCKTNQGILIESLEA